MNSKKKSVSDFVTVGIGELLWDEYPGGRQIGGAPSNFAYQCQNLGAEAYVVSTVGVDDAGRDLLEELHRKEVNRSFISTDRRHPTGSVSVLLDSDGVPRYTIHEQVAWDFLPESDSLQEFATRADAVCFGTLAQRSPSSRKSIQSFLSATHPECLRIFDINLRQHYYDLNLIEESLRMANVLKLNEEELAVVSKMFGWSGEVHALLKTLAKVYSLEVIALTMAERGCIIRTHDQTVQQDGAIQEHVRDTVGAGDCFSAALTIGLLQETSLEGIAAKANQLASYVCTQAGGMPDMP
ncbi:MAG: carbohydrate kinase [Rhodothermales bacterium]|jgi:fructokinase|nr:carbohydrate kinase [Rhodothermales bacterium]HAY36158.1 carbohydrate kinase [Bacteroidota bacterium]